MFKRLSPRTRENELFAIGPFSIDLVNGRYGVTFAVFADAEASGAAVFSGHIDPGMGPQCRALAQIFDAPRPLSCRALDDPLTLPMAHLEFAVTASRFAIRALYAKPPRRDWISGEIVPGMGMALRRLGGWLDDIDRMRASTRSAALRRGTHREAV